MNDFRQDKISIMLEIYSKHSPEYGKWSYPGIREASVFIDGKKVKVISAWNRMDDGIPDMTSDAIALQRRFAYHVGYAGYELSVFWNIMTENGLVIVSPITPSMALVLIDGRVYRSRYRPGPVQSIKINESGTPLFSPEFKDVSFTGTGCEQHASRLRELKTTHTLGRMK